MGYIIALIILAIVVPLLFVLLSRRTTGTGGIESRSTGVTRMEPSADNPQPPGGGKEIRLSSPDEKKLPPA